MVIVFLIVLFVLYIYSLLEYHYKICRGDNFSNVYLQELAGEIILTLGEAFEIAYQMALKDRAELEAEEFEKLSTSDGDDTTSISSKASINTV